LAQSQLGKVSGLQINETSGGVNGGTRIVEGSRSITGNNEALSMSDSTLFQQQLHCNNFTPWELVGSSVLKELRTVQ
jgi:hypothetical protein